MMEQVQQQVPMFQQSNMTAKPDYESVLALNNANQDIQNFAMYLLGIRSVRKNSAPVAYERDKKPFFTYEANSEMLRDLEIQVNKITMRTTFGPDDILAFNQVYAQALNDWMCTTGIQSFITHKAWKAIVDTKWSEYGLQWEISSPVTDDMLNFVKKRYGLERESANQSEKIHILYVSILYFVSSGRNKSLEHLMLGHEASTHQETVQINPNMSPRHTESVIGRMKESVQRMTGGPR
jgi:hypothetical protein